jgi:hypothetical protein
MSESNEIQVFNAGEITARLSEERQVVRFMSKRILASYATNLGGRTYVQVAGATYLAAALGYTVREVEARRVTIDLGNGQTLGAWEAVSEVIDRDGVVRGRGSGICADDEPSWSKRPHFARRAMASTRSAGRALRLLVGHLFPLLGEAVASVTAEEMPNEQA